MKFFLIVLFLFCFSSCTVKNQPFQIGIVHKDVSKDYVGIFEQKSLSEIIGKGRAEGLMSIIDVDSCRAILVPNNGIERQPQLYHWTVEINLERVRPSEPVMFFGDEARFNELVAELRFLESVGDRSKFDSALENGKAFYSGTREKIAFLFDEVLALVEGSSELGKQLMMSIWDKEAREIVVEKKEEMEEVLKAIVRELPKIYRLLDEEGIRGVKEKLNEAWQLYFDEKREGLANNAGFSMATSEFPEKAKAILDNRIKFMTSGAVLPEVLLLVVPLSKLTKLTKLKKVEQMSDIGSVGLSKIGLGNLSKRAKREILAKEERDSSIVALNLLGLSKSYSSLVDPRKLMDLGHGNRLGNPRFKKLMAYLYEAEEGGVPPKVAIKALYSEYQAIEVYSNSRHVFAPAAEMKNIEAQYRRGKKFGAYSPENLMRLRQGRAPIITSGVSRGEKLEVDHLIPRFYAPELENSMANLTWLSASDNSLKGTKITRVALQRAGNLESESGWIQPVLLKAMTTSDFSPLRLRGE